MANKWTKEQERLLLQLKKQGMSFKTIAAEIGLTESSVKHKYVRINQANNEDKHHHPREKIDQIRKILPNCSDLTILETNAGWGNLSTVYREYGKVLAHDIDKAKVVHLTSLGFEAIKCDSFKEIHKYAHLGRYFNVIDLDSYGFPSKYFPTILNLIRDGYLFMTFPKMGVQQINKIMIRHYEAFWGISLSDKEKYLDKIISRLEDYAFMAGRQVKVLDVVSLDRVYRVACRVEKKSLCDIVGLVINRRKEVIT